jgi:phytoene dehydrogenase-like protein
LPLENHGLQWVHPDLPLAHPLDGGIAASLQRSVAETGKGLEPDSRAYVALMEPLVRDWDILANEFLRPLLRVPRHPVKLARFGLRSLSSAARLARSRFSGQQAQALFAGLAGHSFLRLEEVPSAAFGLVLGMLGHAVGWPSPRGGSQHIAEALAEHLRSLGGEIVTGFRVERLDQLPVARATLLDITPLQLIEVGEDKLPDAFRSRLLKYRYGPGVFKIDYALDGPIPWTAEACRRAGTVHVCGTFEEVATSEREVSEGKPPEKPFVLVAQPSLFDSTRAPNGRHTAWAYCHVPNSSAFDMTERIEKQLERFAPGFRQRILAKHCSNCAELEQKNANLVGGDINGGSAELWQLFARPVLSATPYRTPVPGVYLCSSSTPPGGGVHGMCGFHAAEAAIRDWFT